MFKCVDALEDRGVNPISRVEYEINGKIHSITLEWIIDSYMLSEQNDVFVELFKKALKSSDAELKEFFEQMGKLLLMSSLSKEEFND